MKINLKAVGFQLTPSLKTFIEIKIGSLAKFVKSFDSEGGTEVWVEVLRTTKHHRKGLVYRAAADLRLPKKILVAADEDFDVRVAVDGLRRKLRLEIEKYKTKNIEAERRRSEFDFRSGSARR